jgi:malonyl-ACP decarboxylase
MREDAVLVTGMGVRCALGGTLAGFTAALRRGDSGIGPAPGPAPFAAPLPGPPDPGAVPGLDAESAARVRRLTRRARPGLRAAVAAALAAWLDAGLDARPVPAERAALLVAGHNLTGRALAEAGALRDRDPAFVPGPAAARLLDTDHVAVLGAALGVGGEGGTVGGASASGNVGLVHAARLLRTGEAEVCAVVGAVAELSDTEVQAFANLGVLALTAPPDGRPCRPFDRAHRGFVPGTGSACVVLETAASAARRGVAAHGELAGWSVRLHRAATAEPDPDAEAAVIRAALAAAGRGPGDVGLVSAHGTGTPAGDRAEAVALRSVFGRRCPPVTAPKALTGHCLHAAGVLEAVAALAQLRAGFAHPNPATPDPIDPELHCVGPVAAPLTADCALSNGFGFGGINTSVVLLGGAAC